MLETFTDALLFLEIIATRQRFLKQNGRNSCEIRANILRKTTAISPHLNTICSLSLVVEKTICKLLSEFKEKSFYKNIPDDTYAYRHRNIICTSENKGITFFNIAFIIGGLTVAYQGFKNMIVF
jgi:hypothetical protein